MNLLVLLKSVLKVADKAVLGGVVTNVIEETETHPKGTVNWIRFAKVFFKYSLPFILVVSFIGGLITIEDIKALLKIF